MVGICRAIKVEVRIGAKLKGNIQRAISPARGMNSKCESQWWGIVVHLERFQSGQPLKKFNGSKLMKLIQHATGHPVAYTAIISRKFRKGPQGMWTSGTTCMINTSEENMKLQTGNSPIGYPIDPSTTHRANSEIGLASLSH